MPDVYLRSIEPLIAIALSKVSISACGDVLDSDGNDITATKRLGYRGEKDGPPCQVMKSGPVSGKSGLQGRLLGKSGVAIDPYRKSTLVRPRLNML
jgi:hypothetical protein